MGIYDEMLLSIEQEKINACYTELGKMYYEANRDNLPSEYAEVAAKIAESEKTIAAHKAEALAKKGLMLCPECGEEIMLRSIFCNFCGKRIDGVKPAAPAAPIAEEPEITEPEITEPEVTEPENIEPEVTEPEIVEPEPEPAPVEPEEPEATERVCKSCGAVLEEGSLFCVECGARVEDTAPAAEEPRRVCPECGNTDIEKDAMFCTNCGSRLTPPSGDVRPKPSGVKRCPNCGFNTTDRDVMFCIECGTKLV